MMLAMLLNLNFQSRTQCVTVPFNIPIWERNIKDGPCKQYILDGLRNGFDIHIQHGKTPEKVKFFRINLTHAQQLAIFNWLEKGIRRGYILGPFCKSKNPYNIPPSPISDLHLSPSFVVPKDVTSWRAINHLSCPKNGLSVNACIEPAWRTVQYVSLRDVVSMVQSAGVGAWFWVIDALDAYYRVPVRKQDWKYLGLEWHGYQYIMTCLPMGLSSSCKIYTKFADSILNIALNERPDLFCDKLTGKQFANHYLDDFFGVHSSKKYASEQFKYLYNLFKRLNIPTRIDKCRGPAQSLKCLGWLYDTIAQYLRLTNGKYLDIIALIDEFLNKKYTFRKPMEQLVGNLTHAATVVFPGKAFLRRLHMLLYYSPRYDVKLYLTPYIKQDLLWWQSALTELNLNGVPFDYILKNPRDCDIEVTTDACTDWGVGGWHENQCFSLCWTDTILEEVSNERPYLAWIDFLELLGAVVAAELWGHLWAGFSVLFWIDNTTAEAAIVHKHAALWRNDMNYLIRRLARCAFENHFFFWVDRITSKDNWVADRLSRGKVPSPRKFVYKNVKSLTNTILVGASNEPPNGRGPPMGPVCNLI